MEAVEMKMAGVSWVYRLRNEMLRKGEKQWYYKWSEKYRWIGLDTTWEQASAMGANGSK